MIMYHNIEFSFFVLYVLYVDLFCYLRLISLKKLRNLLSRLFIIAMVIVVHNFYLLLVVTLVYFCPISFVLQMVSHFHISVLTLNPNG